MTANKKKLINNYFTGLFQVLNNIDQDEISNLFNIVERKLRQKKTIFFAGNGGSAATAAHALTDLSKTILGHGQNYRHLRIRSICLSDNTPLLTAIGNDIGYEEVFAEPLKNMASPGDLLIVISGSGNSPNIIRAIESAKDLQIETLGLLGFNGGKAIKIVDHTVLAKSESFGLIEDAHMTLIHLLTEYLKTALIRRDS